MSTTTDIVLYHTAYNTRLSRIVSRLPLPKRWKMRFLMWQFHGLANLALRKMRRVAQ